MNTWSGVISHDARPISSPTSQEQILLPSSRTPSAFLSAAFPSPLALAVVDPARTRRKADQPPEDMYTRVCGLIYVGIVQEVEW